MLPKTAAHSPWFEANGECGRIINEYAKPTMGAKNEAANQVFSRGLFAGRPHLAHFASFGGAMKVLPQNLHLIWTDAALWRARSSDDWLEELFGELLEGLPLGRLVLDVITT